MSRFWYSQFTGIPIPIPIFIFLLTFCLFLHNSSSLVASDSDVETTVEGNTEFAIDLYKRLKATAGNLFFSPYSISTAFAMTYAGAREETAKQMAAVLHFRLENDKLHSAFSDIQAKLNAIQRKKQIQLSIANSLWPQENYPFLKEYTKLVKKNYRSVIIPVDYRAEPEAACEEINQWVEERTEGKIKDIIPKTPSPLTHLILVNAIYFKGDWARQFKKSATKVMPFYLKESASVKVPMMNQESSFRYGEDEHLQVLELPYFGNQLTMLIILPRRIEGIHDVEEILTVNNLEGWTDNVSGETVEVYLPRFKMTSVFSLSEELKFMGMVDAFDIKKANFAGMDGDPDWLHIDAVFHKAFVDVNEEGTEAAAATGIVMRGESVPPPPVIFRADHPFLFLIRDNSTKSILFMGRMYDPSPE